MQHRGRADWLQVVLDGLARVGVGVTACRACAGDAVLVLDPGPEPNGRPGALEVTVTRERGQRAFARLPGLDVGYRASEREDRELVPAARRAMAVLVRLLERLEPRLPADLDSPTVRTPEGIPAHQALAFAFPFCTAERAAGPGGPFVREVLARVTGRCNQACPFCSAPLPRADPSQEAVRRLLDHAVRMAPDAVITLTGGEPTLRRDLPELVSLALAAGREVVVQTNAVRLAEAGAVERFPASAAVAFFVSLHAVDAALYDACTGTRGMLASALAGIDRLLAGGHRVVLSFVATGRTAPHLVEWVEAVAERFRGPSRPAIHASIVLCPDHRPAAAEWLVDYRVLGPALEAAWDRAAALGLVAEPLLSSSHAAIPACCLSPGLRARRAAPPTLEPRVASPRDEPSPGWVKPPRCASSCRFGATCLGVPRAWADRFGTGGLEPIE